GAGIPPQDLPHIFERFHQAGEVLSREAEGAGLGLYITKRLVEAMGGTIDVSSTPGEGSTFRITLPLAGEAEAPPQGLGGAGSSSSADAVAPSTRFVIPRPNESSSRSSKGESSRSVNPDTCSAFQNRLPGRAK